MSDLTKKGTPRKRAAGGGSKPKHDKPLVQYATRLQAEHRLFLRSLENASSLLSELIRKSKEFKIWKEKRNEKSE